MKFYLYLVKECPDDNDGTQHYPAICSNSVVTSLGGTSEPVVPGVTTGPVVPTVDPVVPLVPHIDDAEVEPGELFHILGYVSQAKFGNEKTLSILILTPFYT